MTESGPARLCIAGRALNGSAEFALALIFPRFAGRVARVALKLSFGLKRRLAREFFGVSNLSRDGFGLQCLLPCELFGRQFRGALGFCSFLLGLSLCGSMFARFHDSAAFGFSLDDGRIVGIIFWSGQKSLRLGFSGIGRGSLPIENYSR